MKYQENEKEIEKNIENVKKNMVVQMLQLLITEKLIKLENAFNKDAYATLNEWIKLKFSKTLHHKRKIHPMKNAQPKTSIQQIKILNL